MSWSRARGERHLFSRVFLCLLAPRKACAAEAAQLIEIDPEDTVARKVLQGLAAIAAD